MNTKNFRAITPARCVLGLAILLLLSGCVGSPQWGRWSHSPAPEDYAAGRAQPARSAAPGAYGR
ncbi:MAG: hypothetical protein PSV13_00820 [Lacunisphaera sp.]|nr:hypothetical protein [Lacunisphaera sp.]